MGNDRSSSERWFEIWPHFNHLKDTHPFAVSPTTEQNGFGNAVWKNLVKPEFWYLRQIITEAM